MLRLLLVIGFLIASQNFAIAEACFKGYRAWIKGGPPLREYACKVSPQDERRDLRVSLLRLNEGLVGNLVLGEETPEIRGFFGDFELTKNEVFEAIEPLFRRFANKQVYRAEEIELALNIRAATDEGPDGWKSIDLPRVSAPGMKYRRLWTLSTPFDDSSARYAVNVQKDMKALSNGWPPDSKMTYTCLENAIACTRVWRFVKLPELQSIARDTESLIRRVNRGLRETDKDGSRTAGDQEETSSWPLSTYQFRTHFKLYEYLGKNGWPSDFLLLTGDALEGCTTDFEFGYHARPLALDVAVLENSSNVTVRVENIVGTISQDRALRSLAASIATPRAAAKPLEQSTITIPAGSKAIIPLRILFTEATEAFRKSSDIDIAQRMFRRIQEMPKGSVFSIGRTYKAKREAFLPPELPSQTISIFGPEIKIAAVYVTPEGAAPDDRVWNRVALSTAPDNYEKEEVRREEERQAEREPSAEPLEKLVLHQTREVGVSCPYLYAYDSGEQAWVSYGKIIEDANTPEREMTAVIPVDEKARRFRLAEEEPEVAYIRSVKLILTLDDGRTVELTPRPGRQSELTGFKFVVPAYEQVDFEFDVPVEHERAGVRASALAVTGYYTRLSSFRTAGATPIRWRRNACLQSFWR